MRTLSHSLVYLALGLWLGALVFFGAILAPIAFSQLPPLFASPAAGVHAAGMVVGDSLVRLHWIGLFCGLIFLVVLGDREGSLPDHYSAGSFWFW